MIDDIIKSKLIAYGLPLIIYFLIFYVFLKHLNPPTDYQLVDFDCFYLAGKLFWMDKLYEAYDIHTFLHWYKKLYSTTSFMPWTYPPQFNLVTVSLATFSKPQAFLVFTLITFSAYLLMLKRVADKYFPLLVSLMFPCILLNTFTGQNGFLTAFLLGMFFYAYHYQRSNSGYILGLLIIKPQIALGAGLLVLIDRQWGVALRALAVILLSSFFCTIVFGQDIWQAFFKSLHQSKQLLELGVYPLERMVSTYAMLKRMRLSSDCALALQIVEAVGILYMLFKVYCNIQDQRMKSALFILGGLFISPYLYDYDMTVLGLVLGFALPLFLPSCSSSQKFWLFTSTIMVASWKLILSFAERIAMLVGEEAFEHPVTFGNLFLLVIFFILMQVAISSTKMQESAASS